jgi:hypothetical protein
MADKEAAHFLSSLDAELSARSSCLTNVDSLDFVNGPAESGPYQFKTPDELVHPNVGLHALKSTPNNYIFLEHESRLFDILRILESMNTTEGSEAREDMEDRVFQELVRINRLKEIEWSGQRSKHGIKGAVVNTGMSLFSRWRLQLIMDNNTQRVTLRTNTQRIGLSSLSM